MNAEWGERTEETLRPRVVTEIELLVVNREKRKKERQELIQQCDLEIDRIDEDLMRAYEMLRKALGFDVPGDGGPSR